MPNFDFITHAGFREALEADHAEMIRCSEVSSWKSVAVLAGSIVEALLIDYLVASKSSRKGKDPLRMDLAEAIAVCKAENVLTERTADLASVVRSYRNLIHPGRAVRLEEAQPNASTGTIAIALVDSIVNEVAQTRKAAFGLTAEQISSKVERDSGALAILKHLLNEVGEREKERLLLEVIPDRYFNIAQGIEDLVHEDAGVLERMKKAHRVIFESVSEAVQTATALKFVDILKNEDGDTVSAYALAFFRGTDIVLLPTAQQSMVKEFILSKMQAGPNSEMCQMVERFEVTLEIDDVMKWVDPIVRMLHSSAASSADKRHVREYFSDALVFTSLDVDRAIERRLNDWIAHFGRRKDVKGGELAESLRSDVPGPGPTPLNRAEDKVGDK